MTITGAARKIRRNFDQVSVICVFGSVVGCVVLPLVMQSLETFIFTVIVFSITLKTFFGKKLFPGDKDVQEERRRGKDDKKSKKHGTSVHQKKTPHHVQVVTASETGQRHCVDDIKKQEEVRLAEKERRLEEKREKKARKREERIKRKEEEKKEKEKEEELRRQRMEERAVKKAAEKERKGYRFIPTLDSIRSMVSQKPVRRERKNSTSSTASSVSAHSNTSPHTHKSNMKMKGPLRASSDPQLSYHSPSPSPPRRAWQPLGSPQWSGSDNINRSFPHLQPNNMTSSCDLQTTVPPLLVPASSSQQSPPSLWACSSSSSHPAVPPSMVHPETVGTSLPPVETLRPQTGWLPSATTNNMQYSNMYYWAAPGHHLSNDSTRCSGNTGFNDSNYALSSATNCSENTTATFNNGSGFPALNNGCYSLFSDQSQLPFVPNELFAIGTSDFTSSTSSVSNANLLLSGETSSGVAVGCHGDDKGHDNEDDVTKRGQAQQRVEFDEWPNL